MLKVLKLRQRRGFEVAVIYLYVRKGRRPRPFPREVKAALYKTIDEVLML